MNCQIILASYTILAAARDGVTELLRSSTSGSADSIKKRLWWWHYTGVGLYGLAVLPWIGLVEWWRLLVFAMLYRMVFFNPVRNLVCFEPIWYVGHTAHTDILMRRIAGQNSAWLITIAGIIGLIVTNLL